MNTRHVAVIQSLRYQLGRLMSEAESLVEKGNEPDDFPPELSHSIKERIGFLAGYLVALKESLPQEEFLAMAAAAGVDDLEFQDMQKTAERLVDHKDPNQRN